MRQEKYCDFADASAPLLVQCVFTVCAHIHARGVDRAACNARRAAGDARQPTAIIVGFLSKRHGPQTRLEIEVAIVGRKCGSRIRVASGVQQPRQRRSSAARHTIRLSPRIPAALHTGHAEHTGLTESYKSENDATIRSFRKIEEHFPCEATPPRNSSVLLTSRVYYGRDALRCKTVLESRVRIMKGKSFQPTLIETCVYCEQC